MFITGINLTPKFPFRALDHDHRFFSRGHSEQQCKLGDKMPSLFVKYGLCYEQMPHIIIILRYFRFFLSLLLTLK